MEVFTRDQYTWKFRVGLSQYKQVTTILILLILSVLGNAQAAAKKHKPYLLINHGHHIDRYGMDGKSGHQIVSTPGHPIAISYDSRNNLLYWSERGTIKQANLDGSEVVTLLCSDLIVVDGLAADWVTGNLYFTDYELNIVGVINTTSSFYKVLIQSSGKADPRAIVLDPATRVMYWTDWGSEARIERASMDGSDRKVLIDSDLKWPNGLTIDYQSQTLYWVDGLLNKLECSKVDGSNRRSLTTIGLGQPFGISLHQNVLYITNWKDNTLRSFDLVASNFVNIVAVIDSVHRPFGIEVVTSQSQKIDKFTPVHHPFKSGIETSQCQRFEFIEGDKAYLLLNHGPHIYQYSLDGQGSNQLVSTQGAIALSYDLRRNVMYWSEVGMIKKASLNGSEVSTLLSGKVSVVDGLAADWITGNLYYTDVQQKVIGVLDYTGSFYGVLISTGKETNPRAIILDPATRTMYWTDWGSEARIERASMDGSNRKVLIDSDLKWPNGLTIEYQSQTLYWTDGIHDTLESSKVDGKNRIILTKVGLGQPFGITLYQNILHISDWDPPTLQIFHIDNSSYVIKAALLDPHYHPFGNEVVTSTRQIMIHNPCESNTAKCKELCLLSTNENSYSCANTKSHDSEKAGLAADWITGNLYYSDTQQKVIGVLDNYTGSFDGVLIQTGEESIPNAIILDPSTRMIYWTDWGSEPCIKKASMDGTGREVLHNTGLGWPSALTIDFHSQTLFWIDGKLDKLESSKVDGSERIILTEKGLGNPFDMTLYQNLLYISNWGPPAIRVFHIGESSSASIAALLDPHFLLFGIEVVTSQRQIKANNSCENNRGRCRELCLLSSNEHGYSCVSKNSHGILEYDPFTGVTFVNQFTSNITWTSHQGNDIQGNLKERSLQGDPGDHSYSSPVKKHQKGSKVDGCTPIKSSADLKQVLKKVPVTIISPEELCAHLDFRAGTCVRMKEKTSSSLSQKYMEQHPNPCWEHIVEVFCEEFYIHMIAYDLCKKYGVPDAVYSKYCEV